MALVNAFGAIALDATVAAGNALLTSIRDAVQGVLTVRIASAAGRVPTNLNFTSTAGTNARSIVTSGRWLQEVTITNPTTTAAYLKVYDKATAPTVGTDVPRFGIPIPALSTIVTDWGANGKAMSNGIGIALTGGIALLDTSAAVAGIVVDGTYI